MKLQVPEACNEMCSLPTGMHFVVIEDIWMLPSNFLLMDAGFGNINKKYIKKKH